MITARRMMSIARLVLVAGLASTIVVSTSRAAAAATGTLLLEVPVRWPGGARVNAPASNAQVLVNGVTTTADVAGVLTWAGTNAATVQPRLQTAQIQVANAAGLAATTSLTLNPGSAVSWSATAIETVDAQLSAFIHAEKARAYCKTFAPTLDYLDGAIAVFVNRSTACDAHADGTNLFFGVGAATCENPARVADVVYQMFGANLYSHAVAAAGLPEDGPLRLAAGDYLAATMTGNPGIAPGLDRTATPARTIDPTGREYVWPADTGDDVTESLIASGAWWDLRKLLVTKMGAAAGAAKADQLFYASIQAFGIGTEMYSLMVAADDDDANLDDGTPDLCEIKQALKPHGLVTRATVTAAPNFTRVVPPNPTGFDVSLRLMGVSSCAVDGLSSATLRSRIGTDVSTTVDTAMTYDASTTSVSGHLASEPPGTSVTYQVVLALADATTITLPGTGFYLLTVQATATPTPRPTARMALRRTLRSDIDDARADAVAEGGMPGDAGVAPLDAAADAPASGDASAPADARADGGGSDGPNVSRRSSGCGCAVVGPRPEPFAALLTLMAAVLVGRRRRRSRVRR